MTEHEHGRGCIPDPPGLYQHFAAAHPADLKVKAMRLPDAAGPEAFAAPMQNQGGLGECVGRAVGSALYTLLGSKGRPPRAAFSARACYNLARAVDRAALCPKNSPLPPLEDGGCSPNQAARAITKYGLPDILDIDGGILDAQPALVCTELTLDEYLACDNRRVDGLSWTTIPDDAPDQIDQLVTALASGYPACVTVDAGQSEYQTYDGTEPLDCTGRNWDHENYLTFYKHDAAGALLFLLRNSWGTSGWGDMGMAWVTERFVRASTGLLVPRLQS
jgi:hypothetical protein